MKTSLITSLSIVLALVGQGAVALVLSTENPAQANEAIAAVGRLVNSSTQPASVISPGTKQGIDNASPKLQPIEISRIPISDGSQVSNATRLRQIAESVRVDRNASTEPQRIILMKLP